MKTPNHLLYWGSILVVILGAAAVPGKVAQAAGTINLTAMGSTYTQDFDSLVGSGTSSTLPTGWDLIETGSNANSTYAAGTGSSATGNTYSFGAAGSSDRALGGLRSTALIPVYGASFMNDTGSAITSLTITYTGEEWRLGTTGRTDRLIFEYSTDATSLTSGTWTGVPALDFLTPDTSTSGAKNGNAASERTRLSATISGLNIANGTTFWIHWLDLDAPGADDGLAIDDFSLTPQIDLSINDVTLREGASGATTFTFTVSLSASAPPVGVTFDITTANDTATTAEGDYVANQLSGQAIPAGSARYTFDVLVSGDLLAEPDETFLVNITNVTGANIADGQGLGTITNDDTTTTVATSGSPSGFGAPVTFTTTVNEPGAGTPTGTVEFFDDGNHLGTGVLNAAGQAAFSTSALGIGSHTITAAYGGDVSFGGSTSPGLMQIVEGPPGVLRITDALGEEIVENEHTNAVITQLLVVFSKAMNAGDAALSGNYHLVRDGSPVDLSNGATYNNATFTTTLDLSAPLPLPNGRYTLTVEGHIRDTLGAPIGTDFVRVFYVDNGAPVLTSVTTIQGGAAIVNDGTINIRFSSIDVTFNEDVANQAGNIDPDDVTNPANYLLITPGPNSTFDTLSCAAGLAGDDVQIPTGPVTYSSGAGSFVATVQLNNGVALANGRYQLFICGTTSIVDLANNPLNGGADDQRTFTVLILESAARRNPRTGFPPGVLTLLPEQPADKAYSDLGSLWIEIPRLNLKASITGVPLKEDGWDVAWLNRQIGWLEGTAYPTWAGNTVLTAHGYTADGEAGPFALLKNLSYGDTIIIHFNGMKYTYVVRTNLLTSPENTSWVTRHEKLDWVTLITCQQYDEKTQSYRYRRVVRAVLISVEQE